MFRSLRQRLLPLLLHSPSRLPASHTSSVFSPFRHLSTTASTISPKPFAVEDYLVTTCGLTRAQALKASKRISHLKSPSKPDAVIAFLSDLGLPRSDIAVVVSMDPRFLCAKVEKTLAPRVAQLSDLGLSRPQIASLVPLALGSFRCKSLGRNLAFWLSAFGGSFEVLAMALRVNRGLLSAHIERVAKPNLALLQQLGLSARDFSKFHPRVLNTSQNRIQDAVMCIDEIGLNRNSTLFRRALVMFTLLKQEHITKKFEALWMLGWSKDDARMAVRKMPCILGMSIARMVRNLKFLTRDVGLEIPYIAQRPVLIKCSLERRLLPRHCVLKDLKAKGLLNADVDFYNTVTYTDKKFIDKFVLPYKESTPDLGGAYFA
ncbi:hypothetical protein BAE44_0025447 [Dichanthelium oligosanthes]|uniref:Uncharacterized protein n=1 Tax=Dichanthelium oligosanthes TaxID=888268 RepID=A0A1E5UKX9_9POAL|nr:hypothetical protein BAE44_0025447 [Dichanthelium oligosanthes]